MTIRDQSFKKAETLQNSAAQPSQTHLCSIKSTEQKNRQKYLQSIIAINSHKIKILPKLSIEYILFGCSLESLSSDLQLGVWITGPNCIHFWPEAQHNDVFTKVAFAQCWSSSLEYLSLQMTIDQHEHSLIQTRARKSNCLEHKS